MGSVHLDALRSAERAAVIAVVEPFAPAREAAAARGLATYTDIDALLAGGRTKDVSEQFGLSPGRVSQLRRDFLEDWRRFTGAVEG